MRKVVVISGGSDGLGKAIAKRLVSKCRVIILSPTKEKLEKVAKELKCDYEVCDVSDFKQCKTAVEHVIKKYKRIDCLINSAGLNIQWELDDYDPDDIRKVVEVNTLGTVFLTKVVIPYMKKQRDGLIININSQAGFYAKEERSVYNPSKWFVTGFTKCLQSELAKYGIRVTGVYPALMNTKMHEKIGIKKDMGNALDVEDVAQIVEMLVEFNKKVVFPEVGMRHIDY